MRYILTILLVLLFCVPASAEIVHLSNHSEKDVRQACTGTDHTTFHSDSDGYSCQKDNCDGNGGHCTVSCDKSGDCWGGTPGRAAVIQGLMDPTTIDTAFAPPDRFGLAHVTWTQLTHACRSVSGALFGGDRNQYFCVNPHCDPGIGSCYVECDFVKCAAAMAKRPEGRLTLVAILQGGKGVLHGTPLDEAGTTRSGASPDAPKAPPVVLIP